MNNANTCKVSIIVPFYNTEKYIERCLDSLVNQTLKDIEIICVNDGSTDNSAEIVNRFADNDSRIKIIEQTNQKQGAARNNGFKIAVGEYVGYVDSDDWVDLDYYERLYNAATRHDADIALATNVRTGNGKTKKRLNIKKEELYINLQDKFDICNQAKNPCPTNKIYRTGLLKKHHITWPEGCFCEDKLFTVKAVFFADGVVTVPNVQYYYFRNPSSTVNTKTKEKLKQLLIDKNNANKAVLEFLKDNCANIRDRDFWAIKAEYRFLGRLLYKIKMSLYTEKHYLFGFIPLITITRKI